MNKAIDKYSNEIYEGEYVDLGIDGVIKVYQINDVLYVNPFDDEIPLNEYKSSEIQKCERDGTWI